jgi:hypothetical protein
MWHKCWDASWRWMASYMFSSDLRPCMLLLKSTVMKCIITIGNVETGQCFLAIALHNCFCFDGTVKMSTSKQINC